MCKIGDIILVKKYVSHGVELGKHSFVVLNADNGEIQGLPYDLVCNVMSSFHSEEHKERKLRFQGNIQVSKDDVNVLNGNSKEGFIKADQLYYFKRAELDYLVIGSISIDLYLQLINYINQLSKIEEVVDNLGRSGS